MHTCWTDGVDNDKQAWVIGNDWMVLSNARYRHLSRLPALAPRNFNHAKDPLTAFFCSNLKAERGRGNSTVSSLAASPWRFVGRVRATPVQVYVLTGVNSFCISSPKFVNWSAKRHRPLFMGWGNTAIDCCHDFPDKKAHLKSAYTPFGQIRNLQSSAIIVSLLRGSSTNHID